ncbi:DUF5830 family protein [Salinibaculum rarum]|uniref:DUF5830 family protein n=1 Tax=Salinibaculum rarum TaxID=3058903 RepID=UPI00265F33E1|nr:DUF5830 family protein [Salinibaculum sp. KK48]
MSQCEGDALVERALDLLRLVDEDTLTIAETVDRIEHVTSHPRRTREILDAADRRGIIERDEDRIIMTGSAPIATGELDTTIVTKDGDFSCERCGSDLSTGYFLDVDHGDVGPFGSTCIRKVTGRD